MEAHGAYFGEYLTTEEDFLKGKNTYVSPLKAPSRVEVVEVEPVLKEDGFKVEDETNPF
jgi:hypothetical protein